MISYTTNLLIKDLLVLFLNVTSDVLFTNVYPSKLRGSVEVLVRLGYLSNIYIYHSILNIIQ